MAINFTFFYLKKYCNCGESREGKEAVTKIHFGLVIPKDLKIARSILHISFKIPLKTSREIGDQHG